MGNVPAVQVRAECRLTSHQESTHVASNPFAPPKSEVADVIGGKVAPALWNPNAAANWSLLFSPIFGAFLHMKNWEELGEPDKAKASRQWVIAGIVVFVVLALARHQTAYVKARFGKVYPRKGWSKPLALAVLGVLAFILALAALGFLLGLALGGTVPRNPMSGIASLLSYAP